MKKFMIWAPIIFIALMGIWALWTYVTESRVEQPTYTVIEKRSGYEIRTYDPYIIASVTVEGNETGALYDAFPILAGYIFGGNVKKEKIAMTAPVVAEESEKIAMTAPVISEESDSGVQRVSFVMPKRFTLETLPIPNDARISFRETDTETVAVLSFRGWYSGARVYQKKQELLQLLEKDGIAVAGDLRFAGYNSPFAMPLLVHSEILVPIKYSAE